jgi:hypothetical protein
MTAILGMNCSDGVLLLADTEETTSRDTKSEADKLFRFLFPMGIIASGGADRVYRPIIAAEAVPEGVISGTVLMGGAGDSHFIECANQELQEFLGQGLKEGESIKAKLNEFTTKFFRVTIGEYRGFVAEMVPSIAMLIALSCKGQTWLFRWEHNRVSFVPKYRHTSIGCGMIQMHPMLREVQFSSSCEAMVFHGIRIMLQTKKTVQGVGGKTEAIALLNDGATQFFPPRLTRLVEELIEDIGDYHINIIHSIVCAAVNEPTWTDPVIANLPSDIKQYRDRYLQIVKPSVAQRLMDRQ